VMIAGIVLFLMADFCYDEVKSGDDLNIARAKVKSHKAMVQTGCGIWLAWLLICIGLNSLYPQALEFIIWGVVLFVTAYSSNRKYGYTRAFMRNTYYEVKVETLIDALENDLDSIDSIRSTMHQICIEATAQAHKDTVGDYLEVNNAALKWLSSRKTKV